VGFELENILRIQRDNALKLSGTSDLEKMYEICTETIVQLGGFDGGLVYNVEPSGNLVRVCQINIPDELIEYQETRPHREEEFQQLMSGKPIYLENLESHGPAVMDYKSGALIPIKYQNKVIAAVFAFSKTESYIVNDIRQALAAIAAQIGGALARAKAENACAESEQQLRNMTEEMSEGMAVTVDFKNVWVNPAFCNIFGYLKDELLGQGPEFVIEPLSLPNLLGAAKTFLALKMKESPHIELKGIKKDGSIIDIDVVGKIIDYGGQEAIQIIIHDISDLKQAEQERQKAEQELRDAEEKYRFISENVGDIVFLTDENLKILYGNEQSLLKKLGYTVNELSLFHMGDFVYAEDFKTAELILSALTSVPSSITGEIRLVDKNGTPNWFEFECSSYFDSAEKKRSMFLARDIQDKKEQEFKLRESEEKFRLIAENSSDLIFLYDNNMRMIYGNEQVLGKKLGWMLDEFRAFKMNDFIHPDGVISFFSAINYVKKRPMTSQQREVRLANKLNEYRWFLADISSYEDDNGQLRILVIFRDINERKIQELQLRDSEERYRLMNENVNDIIILQDQEFNILYCNEQAMIKKLGYSLPEITEMHMRDIILVEDYAKSSSIIKDLFNNPGSFRKMELQLTCKDGKPLWFDMEMSSYVNEKNEVILLTVARDIQDKKENESKLIDTNERMRIITENIQDFVAIINPEGEFEYVSESVEQYGGFPFDLIGENIEIISYPDDMEKIKSLLKECFENGTARGTLRTVVPGANGETSEPRWFEAIGKTFHDDDGNLKALIIARDISERMKVDEILESENKLLKEIDKLQKDFVLNATHELKTPLSIIIGASDFLTKYYNDVPEPKRLDFLNSIHKGSVRLKQLIDNLLDYSRIESGRLQLENLEQADIVELVQNALQSISYLINRRQQQIEMDIPSSLIAKIDKFRIEQVITNLISNAVKNTQPGGKIHIMLEEKNDQAEFSVTDNGVGLNREEMSRLFQKFGKIERKIDADIDIQGTGLGLFIAKEIVEMHGGKIWAESEGRNKGSKFLFTIPLQKNE